MAAPLLQLVSNPKSGSHDPALVDAIADALRRLGYRVTTASSTPNRPYTPDPLASHVCVAGGDGTIRHVAAALSSLPNPPGFSVYPMGTINLIAREWRAPRDPVKFALHIATQAQQRGLNIVGINNSSFVACASIGPDSLAVAQVSGALKARIGRIAYGVALAKILWKWRAPVLTVTIGDVHYQCGALYIANGRYFAGPWIVAPEARLDDAWVQVTMLKRARRRDFMAFLLALICHRVPSLANAVRVEATSLTIDSDRAMPIQLDGDEGPDLPFSVRVSDVRLPG